MRITRYLVCVLAALSHTAMGQELGGWAEVEGRYFPNDPLYIGQQQNSASAAIQPEIYQEWADERSFTLSAFYRQDSADSQRTHFDIREAMFLWPREKFELRAGIGKVFWGVTEANHLVDVINQTDLVESADGEEKLGQPMVDLTLLTDKGSFDFFILPYFRERTFPGRKGRLRFEPSIDTGRGAIYESKDEERHIDYALRYSNTIGNLDIGVSHFYGTTREPAFLAEFASNGDVSFAPYYEIIKQAGLDLQYVNDAWLWKLEAIYRRGQADGNFYALDAGAEYTFSGHGLRGMELGLIVEYLYDSREFEVDATALLAEGYISSRFNTFLDNDYMIGFRLALNDAASSEILAAVIRDIDSHSSVFQLEASRRIGDGWTVELDVYAFVDVRKDPLLDFVRRDSFAQLALRYYF